MKAGSITAGRRDDPCATYPFTTADFLLDDSSWSLSFNHQVFLHVIFLPPGIFNSNIRVLNYNWFIVRSVIRHRHLLSCPIEHTGSIANGLLNRIKYRLQYTFICIMKKAAGAESGSSTTATVTGVLKLSDTNYVEWIKQTTIDFKDKFGLDGNLLRDGKHYEEPAVTNQDILKRIGVPEGADPFTDAQRKAAMSTATLALNKELSERQRARTVLYPSMYQELMKRLTLQVINRILGHPNFKKAKQDEDPRALLKIIQAKTGAKYVDDAGIVTPADPAVVVAHLAVVATLPPGIFNSNIRVLNYNWFIVSFSDQT